MQKSIKSYRNITSVFSILPLLVFILSFGIFSQFFSYMYTTARVNPYAPLLYLVTNIFLVIISLVPTLTVFYVLKKNLKAVLALVIGGVIGLFELFFTQSFLTISVMSMYISLHDYLFDNYLINIYYLDYSGFAFIFTAFVVSVSSLVTLGIYKLCSKSNKYS